MDFKPLKLEENEVLNMLEVISAYVAENFEQIERVALRLKISSEMRRKFAVHHVSIDNSSECVLLNLWVVPDCSLVISKRNDEVIIEQCGNWVRGRKSKVNEEAVTNEDIYEAVRVLSTIKKACKEKIEVSRECKSVLDEVLEK